ncbi:ABC transporter substrate-binding protein [Cohnella soli]|uniref:Extracellular solute-binding protein n=1 Tax=Cohnella soli TaxID=425005 RepID=A0ABW0HUL0_9BACL
MKGLMAKRMLVSALIVTTTIFLAACSSNKNNNAEASKLAATATETQPASSSPTASDKPVETVKLKVLGHTTWFKSGWDAIKKDALVHGFELVEEKVPDSDAGNDLIKTRFATQDLPDILLYFPGNLFKDFGAPADIFVKQEDQPWMENFDKAAWVRALDDKENLKGDRGFYAAPYWGSNVSVVLYNKKVFTELNLQIPKTYDEYLAVCEALKKAGKTPVFYAGKEAWSLQLLALDAASKKGYNDLAQKINTNQGKFVEYDNLKKGIATLVDLKDKGYVQKDYLSDDYSAAQKALATGTAGMYHMATWVMDDIRKKFPDQVNDIGSFIMPFDGNDTDIVPVFAPYGMFVPKGKNQEAAQRFVNFFESIETQNLYFGNEGGIPAIKGVTETKLSPAELDGKSFVDAGRFSPNFAYGFDYNFGDFGAFLQDALVGSKTPEQVLEAMDKEYAKDAKAKNDPLFK